MHLWVPCTTTFLSSMQGKEFIRIGYYVNNEYQEQELRDTPPEPPIISKLARSILADHPRVTRFPCDFDNAPAASDQMVCVCVTVCVCVVGGGGGSAGVCVSAKKGESVCGNVVSGVSVHMQAQAHTHQAHIPPPIDTHSHKSCCPATHRHALFHTRMHTHGDTGHNTRMHTQAC